MVSNEIMTLREVAAYLQMGPGKVYHLAKTGDIPAVKIGRTWRFRRDLIDAWFVDNLGSDSKRLEVAAFSPDSVRQAKED